MKCIHISGFGENISLYGRRSISDMNAKELTIIVNIKSIKSRSHMLKKMLKIRPIDFNLKQPIILTRQY